MAVATQRPERLRRFHLVMLGLSGFAMAIAGFDLATLSYALAEVREEWRLDPWQLSVPAMFAALGGMAGSAVGGQMADRFGRRGVFQASIVACSMGTLLSAVAPGVVALALAQVLLGIGITALTPAATSLLSEVAPVRLRGRLNASLEAFWITGTLLSAAAALILIPAIEWRGAMAIGGLGLLYVGVLHRLVPESPRFLVAHGRIAEAFALRERLETRWGVTVELPIAEAPRRIPLTVGGRLRELWSAPFRQRTLVLWGLWFVLVFTYRGVFTWLPTLLVMMGQTTSGARFALVLITLAQLPGALLAILLVDRLGRKPILVGGFALAAIAALAFGAVAAEPLPAILVGAAFAASFMAAYSAAMVYSPELYPTRVRATGVGMASSFGRIAAVLSPPVIGLLATQSEGSLMPVFAMFAAGLAGGSVLLAVAGEETRGRHLEDISR